MNVKIISSPKLNINVNNVYVSSDLHLNHEQVIKFGRNFSFVQEMNEVLIDNINQKVKQNDLLILMGDTLMINKDYNKFLSMLNCENVIMLYGNHCNPNRFKEITGSCSNKLLYHGYYLELVINKQIIVCSHYPIWNWNYQNDGSFMLHGHNHSDEDEVLLQIHKYKCMDVGVDNYYKIFGNYNVFSFEQVVNVLKNKKIGNRHEQRIN